MVTVKDGLGRPLYDLDGNERFHPYTGEKVSDNFVYEYPNGSPWSVLPFAIVMVGMLIYAFVRLFILKD